MGWLIVVVLVVGFFVSALTGELIQTQLLHNTVPIAQRGVMPDVLIGGSIWLIIGVVAWIVRSQRKASAQAAAQLQRDAGNAQRMQHEADRKARRDAERRTRPHTDLQKQIASGSFSEDISTPGFMVAWQQVYDRIFHFEDDYEASIGLRHSLGVEVAERLRRDAEECLDRAVREWRSAHPNGPVPQTRY